MVEEERIRQNALSRYKKDVEYYQNEIVDLKKQIKVSSDERQLKHLNNLLVESQRTLTSILMKIEEYEN